MLIQHIRPRLRPAGNAALRVRRGHPLATGLVACIVTGGQFGLGRDLVTGAEFAGTNTPGIALNPAGPAARFSGTAYISAPKQELWNVTGAVSIAWHGVIETPTTQGAIITNTTTGGNGADNTPFSLEYQNSGTANVMFGRAQGAAFTNLRLWDTADNVLIANKIQTVSISQDGNMGTTPICYVDAVAHAMTNFYGVGAGGAAGTNGDPLFIGRRQDGSGQMVGTTNIILVAALEWGVSQHTRFDAAPFAVLEEAPRYYFGATSGTGHTATPGAGSETYAGTGATVTAGATLLPGAGAEAYAGQQATVTAGATVAVGAGAEAYQGLAASVTQPATVEVGAGLVEVLGLQASLGSALHGTLRRRGRYRVYRDVPVELAPAVDLATGYAEAEVERAVQDAMRRLRALSMKASVARRTALVQELNTQIVAAVARAAEADEEDAIAALL